jgi:general secretion pathway protein D
MIGSMKYFTHCLLCMVLLGAVVPMMVSAQVPALPPALPGAAAPAAAEVYELKFRNAPADLLLEAFGEATGRTLLMAPGLPKQSITLLGRAGLTRAEYLEAIQSVLAMYKIGLVPYGERFLKVVPIKSLSRTDAMDIRQTLDKTLTGGEQGELISQMIVLKHIDLTEATKVIEPLRSEFGQAHAFERTNSLLVTDTAANVRRMLEMLRYVDQPIEAREEAIIVPIRYARAADVKARLEEIVRQAQQDQKKRSTVPQAKRSGSPVPRASTAGVIRPRVPIARPRTTTGGSAAPSAATLALAEEAERGVIRGEVKIVSDKRTNQLIFITRPENMKFFKKIIDVLDVETSPDVVVQMIRLEFAEAGEVEKMLNDLIGATSKDDDPKSTTASGDGTEAKPLAEAAKQAQAQQPQLKGESKIGELSKDNIKILSDKRTNSLIIMASESDVMALRGIITDMDMMLKQVLIETVIVEVNLSDSVQTGINWVQRSLTAYRENGAGQKSPTVSFASAVAPGKPGIGVGEGEPSEGALAAAASGGFLSYLTLFDLNMDVVVRMAESDSNARVVQTPIILTTDNTESELKSTEKIYVYRGTTYNGTNSENRNDNYDQQDIGLELKITPRINDDHVVMMEIEQKVDEPGSTSGQDKDNLSGVVISRNRYVKASVAVRSGETVVLAGQVRESNERGGEGVPLLKDIPILGLAFGSKTRSQQRTETLVFITPYVLESAEEMRAETQRRSDALSGGDFWRETWSGNAIRGADSASREAAVSPPVIEPVEVGDSAVEAFLEEQEQGWKARNGR